MLFGSFTLFRLPENGTMIDIDECQSKGLNTRFLACFFRLPEWFDDRNAIDCLMLARVVDGVFGNFNR